jgi:hypothetical protein
MRSKRIVIPLSIVLILVALGWLLIHECYYWAGMGAPYRSCDCSGIEWELYDQTAADGPRETVCIGVVQAATCYSYVGGPSIACE